MTIRYSSWGWRFRERKHNHDWTYREACQSNVYVFFFLSNRTCFDVLYIRVLSFTRALLSFNSRIKKNLYLSDVTLNCQHTNHSTLGAKIKKSFMLSSTTSFFFFNIATKMWASGLLYFHTWGHHYILCTFFFLRFRHARYFAMFFIFWAERVQNTWLICTLCSGVREVTTLHS